METALPKVRGYFRNALEAKFIPFPKSDLRSSPGKERGQSVPTMLLPGNTITMHPNMIPLPQVLVVGTKCRISSRNCGFGILNSEVMKNWCFCFYPRAGRDFDSGTQIGLPVVSGRVSVGVGFTLGWHRMTSCAYLSEARSGCIGVCLRGSHCSELYFFVCELFSLIIPMLLTCFLLLLLFSLIFPSLGKTQRKDSFIIWIPSDLWCTINLQSWRLHYENVAIMLRKDESFIQLPAWRV